MTYLDGFISPVPAANEEAYRRHAAEAAPIFAELGCRRLVEAWGDDVPDGKVNDFRTAVNAEDGETVVFSWAEYPDKAARDAAAARMMTDPRLEAMSASMPFDGKRLVHGGFEALIDLGEGRGGYVDGYVLPVPTAHKARYVAQVQRVAPLFVANGAVRVVEAWGDDVPDGKLTDFRRAAHAQPDETVCFSFIEWPSKEVRDTAWKAIMADPAMQPVPEEKDIFDGMRMFWGGFRPILDSAA